MKTLLEKHFGTIRKLFLEIGIKSITMDDICYKLGISKKTLYKDFTDKNELVTEVFFHDLSNFKTKLLLAQKKSLDAIDETCISFKLIAETQHFLSPTTLYDLRKYHYQLKEDLFQSMNQLLLETISATIHRGILENNFRKDIDPEKIAIIISFFLDAIIMQPLNSPSTNLISLSDNTILDYYFRSICTQQGMELWKSKI
jgi:TetR/AcrR family transcriptional regulator, cholesterol catabolism regulator